MRRRRLAQVDSCKHDGSSSPLTCEASGWRPGSDLGVKAAVLGVGLCARGGAPGGSGSGLRGGAPFIDITVQEIAGRLKQRLGCLIRTDEDEDRGTATILVRRLIARRWGGLLMRGLPDFELVIVPAGQRAAAGTRG